MRSAHLPDYKERFIQFEREMDEEILGSHAFSDDEAFVKVREAAAKGHISRGTYHRSCHCCPLLSECPIGRRGSKQAAIRLSKARQLIPRRMPDDK